MHEPRIVVDPALSFGVGQPLCGLALLLYAFAVLTDLRRKKVL